MDSIFNPLLIGALIVALTIHEFSHALAADMLGDPTARLRGRLTLNPLAHLDPLGSIFFIISTLSGFAFGWAKPVPFDTYNLANPKRDSMMIALAGPASNLAVAVVVSLIIRFLLPLLNLSVISTFQPFFILLVVVNVSLAIFNLIPIHPLDGGKILVGLLPDHLALAFHQFLSQYGSIILIFLLVTNSFSMIIGPIVRLIITILLG